MPRIYLYSHDGEGLGHFRRNLRIAEAATAQLPGCSALLLTGSVSPGLFKLPPRCDFVKIPTLQKGADREYTSPMGAEHDRSSAQLRQMLLRTAIRTAPPDVLVVDKHPGGFRGELLPALKWLQRHSPATQVVLGLRDVIDAPEQVRSDWEKSGSGEIVRRFYCRVWIYGDPRLGPVAEPWSFAPEVTRIAHQCGFITLQSPPRPLRLPGSPALVATVGGGNDGRPVLEAAVRAAAALRHKYPKLSLRLFSGPLMSSDDYRELRRVTEPYSRFVRLERFSERMPRYMAAADAVIAMAGYNTALECASFGCPLVLVPREAPRQEQLIRATSFEQAGLAAMVRIGELEGPKLADVLEQLLDRNSRPSPPVGLNFSGLDSVVRDLDSLLFQKKMEKACV